MKRGYWTLIGFLMFGIAGLSFILALVGVKLTMLKPLEYLGSGLSILVRIIMLFAGIIIIYLSKTDLSEDE